MTATKTKHLMAIPYLGFDGNCAEAMRFYEKVLGGKITVMMTGAQTPMASQMDPAWADRVMNAQLLLPGGGLLYAAMLRPLGPMKVSRVSISR